MRPRTALCLVAVPLAFAGCRSDGGQAPPVFGAVFGLDSAEAVPFQPGRFPERAPGPRDRLLGDAANVPGQCIYVAPNGGRLRADCPEGYAIGDRRGG